jgi:putative nucleotidyltransferase with HDIG domain
MKPSLQEEARKVTWILLLAATPKDGYTSEHAVEVAHLSRLIGMHLGLNEEELQTLELGALLHDLGKLAVADVILEKPTPLTDEEWVAVKRHSEIGARMIEPIEALSGVLPIVRHHHERYDGTGYPDELEGEEIPLSGRIVAAADAYDVMLRGRPHQRRRTQVQALEELTSTAGGQFDSRVVEVLMQVVGSERPKT